jgi:hypothetical protein
VANSFGLGEMFAHFYPTDTLVTTKARPQSLMRSRSADATVFIGIESMKTTSIVVKVTIDVARVIAAIKRFTWGRAMITIRNN